MVIIAEERFFRVFSVNLAENTSKRVLPHGGDRQLFEVLVALLWLSVEAQIL